MRLRKKARQLKAAEINNNAAPAIAAMPAAEVIAPVAEKKKSSVKAAGMKSILVSKNKMYITSFGKGNSAVLEYEVDNNDYNQTQLSSKGSSNIELRGVNKVNITFSRYPPNNPPAALSSDNKKAMTDNARHGE